MSEKKIKYCLYKEGEFIVSQCLNVEVSSFGKTKEEAIKNLKEAVELYYEDETDKDFNVVKDVEVGEIAVVA